ncbi:MAG: dihydrodipicolinate reductase C-terminal domain-containing protein [Vicinamibacterales bacterium]
MNRLLLVGHGRMGTLVEHLAPAYGFELAGIITEVDPDAFGRDYGRIDVAIDFTLPEAVPENLPKLAGRGINVVVGTTGWLAHEAALKAVVERAGTGVLASANFSVGMNLFTLLAEEAARRFGPHADFGAWLHELHHVAKKDAPSGTAVMLQRAMVDAGYTRDIHVAATRAGSIPGTHTIGFDGPSETVTLTHTVRDRGVFARGALEAARWLVGRRGWYSMRDFLMDTGD